MQWLHTPLVDAVKYFIKHKELRQIGINMPCAGLISGMLYILSYVGTISHQIHFELCWNFIRTIQIDFIRYLYPTKVKIGYWLIALSRSQIPHTRMAQNMLFLILCMNGVLF